MESESVVVQTADGVGLAASLLRPSEGRPDVVAILNSAMAVPREFYGRFASWLSERGYAVVTYDYRGVGGSRSNSKAELRWTLHDWGELDTAAMVEWSKRSFPGSRLVVVGHSTGGAMVGLAPNADLVDALVLVCAQSGYQGHYPFPRRLLLSFLWSVVVPAEVRILGHLPGRFGLGGQDLPGGIAREWARWCRLPNYLLDADPRWRPRFARLEVPILAFSFADDPYAPRPAADALLSWYESASIERHHLRPEDVGSAAVGHFGFFRPGMERLWERSLAWARAP